MTGAEHPEWYRRLSPSERRHAAWEVVAKIETALMVEFLSDDRPNWRDAVWVRNIPRGPRGIPELLKVIEEYGQTHVTTGNANPLSSSEVGVYVREDVLESATNPLREHLSKEES